MKNPRFGFLAKNGFWSLFLIAFFSLVQVFSLSSRGEDPSITAEDLMALAFDFDDTIMFTATKIYIFHKVTGAEIAVSTRDFTEIRDYVNKDKPLPSELMRRFHPELRSSLEEALRKEGRANLSSFQIKGESGGSFRDFEDKPGRNVYLESIKRAIEEAKGTNSWQGPQWKNFVKALKNSKIARNVYAISARSHSPEKVYEALLYLQSKGFIDEVPPVENLKMVGGKTFDRYGTSTEERKTNVMAEILDRLNSTASRLKGLGPKVMAKAVFADDDFQNIEKMKHGLEKSQGRWPLVDIVLEYVGVVNPFVEAGKFFLNGPDFKIKCRKAIAI